MMGNVNDRNSPAKISGIIKIEEQATVEASEVTKPVAAALEEVFGPAPLRIPLQEIVFKAIKPD